MSAHLRLCVCQDKLKWMMLEHTYSANKQWIEVKVNITERNPHI